MGLLVAATPAAAAPPSPADEDRPGAAEQPPSISTGNVSEARIVAVVPNPVRDGDEGEHVVVDLPGAGNWSLSDGESRVRLANVTGRVVVTGAPAVLRERIDSGGAPSLDNATVLGGSLSLANSGERLTLRRNGSVVQRVSYGAASEGERYLPATGRWRPRGLVPRAAVSTGPANATAFVLPDSPAVPLDTIESAERRILLAGYTFGSERVTEALIDASRRNVSVRVLVEATPVGGLSQRQARLLDHLVAAGIEVRVIGTAPARFAFHHPKYAVVDDRALVMTENWKPAGTGGRSSRGWGVRVDDADTAAELTDIFAHDVSGPDTRPWAAFRRGRTFDAGHAANGSYPTHVEPAAVHAANVTVLTAPGNAESAVVSRIDAAEERVDVMQPTLGRRDNPLVRATLRAAKRGVEVRILLSGGFYTAEENRKLVASLDDWAERTGAPLQAKVSAPGGRYEKIHAKGLLVDDDLAVVGSLNWNRNSARENREVALALSGPEPVAYFRQAFEADWQGGSDGTPLVFAAGGVAAVVVAGLVARRTLSFAVVEE